MAIDLSCQVKRHVYAERGLDLYETPPPASAALLRVEKIPHCVWEPAAGRGAIVNVLRDHSHTVIASDIVDYGGLDFVADFLKQTQMPRGCDCILTNPPYRLAEAFVAHALALAPLVVMLVRLGFLESERRSHILDDAGLARIHVFKNRLPMMHRDGWSGPKASSNVFCLAGLGAWLYRPSHTRPHPLDDACRPRPGARAHDVEPSTHPERRVTPMTDRAELVATIDLLAEMYPAEQQQTPCAHLNGFPAMPQLGRSNYQIQPASAWARKTLSFEAVTDRQPSSGRRARWGSDHINPLPLALAVQTLSWSGAAPGGSLTYAHLHREKRTYGLAPPPRGAL